MGLSDDLGSSDTAGDSTSASGGGTIANSPSPHATVSKIERLERYTYWLGKRGLRWPVETVDENEVSAGVALSYLSLMLEHGRGIVVLARGSAGWVSEVHARAILEAWLSLVELLADGWEEARGRADLALAVAIEKVAALRGGDRTVFDEALAKVYSRSPRLRDVAKKRVKWMHWSAFRLSTVLKRHGGALPDSRLVEQAYDLLSKTAHHHVAPGRRVDLLTGTVGGPEPSDAAAEWSAHLALAFIFLARRRMTDLGGDPLAEWLKPEPTETQER